MDGLLSQVEAALTNDPENEELLKLKEDLTVSCCHTYILPSFVLACGRLWHFVSLQEVRKLTVDLLELAPEPKRKDRSSFDWKSGDPCRAVWTENGRCEGQI